MDVETTNLREDTGGAVVIGVKLRDNGDGLQSVDSVAVAVVAMVTHSIGVEPTARLVTGVILAWMRCQRGSIGVRLPNIHLVATIAL